MAALAFGPMDCLIGRFPGLQSSRYNWHVMSKAEILAELPKLSPDDLAEVQAKLDELAADSWQDRGELSDADKHALDAALANYQASPNAGISWDEVKARIQAKLRP
jgi:putative addiction module component (TIGR02574 family)